MEDNDYRRLRRLLVVSIVIISILVVGVATLGSIQLSSLKNEFATFKTDTRIPKDGLNGLNGVTESIITYLPPKNGQDGKDGKDATDEQVKAAVNNYFVDHPVKDGKDGDTGQKGDNGNPGAPGLPVFVRQNVLGLWECKFGSDLGWSPIEECQ